MKRVNIRTAVRMGKFINKGIKPNYSKILGSYFKTCIYSKTFIGKRPRCLNWFAGRNKY